MVRVKHYRLRRIICTRTGKFIYPDTEFRERNGRLEACELSAQYAVNPNSANGDGYLTRDRRWRRVTLGKRQRRALVAVVNRGAECL